MNLVTVISSAISGGKQMIKFLRFGTDDVQEKKTISPYGIDSNPIENMVGLYVQTGVKGESVLVGYINKNAIAQPGEIRLFSTNLNGNEQAYIYFKNNGEIHFNGDDDNMVRFSELKQAFDQLKSDFNDHVAHWNSWCTTYVPGSPVFTGLPATAVSLQSTPSSANIDGAKIDQIKTTQ